MSPKAFAAVIGGIMLLIGLFALGSTITVDDGAAGVECGTGFSGASDNASMRDAGRDIAAAMYGDLYSTPSDLEGECADAISGRQAWGWPVGGVGGVVLLGALVIQAPTRRPAGPHQPAATTSDAVSGEPPSPLT